MSPYLSIISAAFSAIITVGALVLPDVIVGMMEASATRSPSTPRTFSAGSTTLASSPPIRQVVLTDALSVLGFTRWHQIDDRYTLDVLDRLLQRGIAAKEVRPLPSTRMTARLIIAATNEAALFVAKLSRQRIVGDDAGTDFVGDQHRRVIAAGKHVIEPREFRFEIGTRQHGIAEADTKTSNDGIDHQIGGIEGV